MRLALALSTASLATIVGVVGACVGNDPDASTSGDAAAGDDGANTGSDGSSGGTDANGGDDAGGGDATKDADAAPSLTVKTSLILWLAADQGVNASGFTWSDLSGGNNDATQANASFRPTKQDMFFPNGMPAVVFAAKQELALPGSPLFDDLSTGVSIFLVFRPSVKAASYLLDIGGSGPNKLEVQQTANEGWGVIIGGGNFPSNQPMTVTELHLFEIFVAGGASGALSFFRDGVAAGTATVTLTNQTREPNFIGGGPPTDAGATAVAQGAYGEILVYKTLVTPMQQGAIESYLMARWGL